MRRHNGMLAALIGIAIATIATTTTSAGATGSPVDLTVDWVSVPTQTLGTYAPSRGVGEQFSSPAVGDLTGDGLTEVVTGSVDGRIYIYDATTGALERRFDVSNVPGVTVSSPALADLDGNGQLDIVVGFMPGDSLAADVPSGTPTVAAFRPDGTRLWGVRTCPTSADHYCNVFASPVIADIDGDGLSDVVITSQDEKLHVLRGLDGSELPGFPFYLYDTTWSTPAVADLNGDGKPEIVVAADMSKISCNYHSFLGCQYGTILRVFDTTGHVVHQITYDGEIPQSSPVIGHIQGPGSAPQIVIGSGNTFFNTNNRSGGYPLSADAARRVYAFDANLNPLAGWTNGPLLDTPTIASPALADVDGNGLDTVYAMSTSGQLTAFNGDGSVRWGPTCTRDSSSGCRADQPWAGRSSPVVADINHDGSLEVLAISERSLRVYDAQTGTLLDNSGRINPSPGAFAFAATPTVVNLNGAATIYLHGLVDANDSDARDVGDKDFMAKITTGTPLGAAPWPSFHGNASHTGTVPAMTPQPAMGCQSTDAGHFVRWLQIRLLGTEPTETQYVSGCTTQSKYPGTSGRNKVASQSVNSRPWVTSVVEALYQDILGRPGEISGVTFWTNRILAGERQRDVAIAMYGSSERYRSWGGTTTNARPYVTNLYTHVLGRQPDPDGLTYWSSQALIDHSRAAAMVYQSHESRIGRVRGQYNQLLCRTPEASGAEFWANKILADDDLELTFNLVGSPEFWRGAIGFTCAG